MSNVKGPADQECLSPRGSEDKSSLTERETNSAETMENVNETEKLLFEKDVEEKESEVEANQERNDSIFEADIISADTKENDDETEKLIFEKEVEEKESEIEANQERNDPVFEPDIVSVGDGQSDLGKNCSPSIENMLKRIESKITQLEVESKTNEEKIVCTEKKIVQIEDHLKMDSLSKHYWMEGERQNKTPLVKENPSHDCQMLTWFIKFTLLFTCVLNYADTFTDLVTTADMFRNHKYVLGSLSLCVMVLVGVWIPFHTRSLTSSDDEERTKWKFSWRNLLAAITLSSTQYFILKKFLLNHSEGKFDRRTCLKYDNGRCRTDKCNNLRHKMRQLHEAIILEKMVENLPQFIIQLINIAPEYLAKDSHFGGFWDYWKLASLFLTSFSLARACVKFDFVRLDLNPRLFSFYSIGKGWKAIYPQKCLLAVIHTSIIINRGLAVIFLAILVNHDFLTEEKLSSCSFFKTLEDINTDEKSSCHFETKVAWLLFFYVLAYYSGVTLITFYIVPSYVYKHSIKITLKGIKSLGSRIKYVLAFVGNLWWIYILNFVLQQRHYMFDVTNHLPNIGGAKFIIKMCPSILHAAGTVTFTILFYSRGNEGFNNVGLKTNPINLSIFGLVVEAIHMVSLLILIYKADPSHVKSLSDEKIVEYLIRKEKIAANIDVSCSRKTKDILKEVVGSGNDTFDIYKEDIRVDIVTLNRKLPPETRTRGLAEFHRTFAEAIKKYSGIRRNEPVEYSSLQQDERIQMEQIRADITV